MPDPNRRLSIALLLSAMAGPVLAARPPVVTILGDSITAGYGLAGSDALPARLQQALNARGVSVVVRGAGVSGDTTGDGLARLDFSVQADTSLCLVALGGNDLLRGLDPAVTRANLTTIVRRLKARHISVLVAGIAAPPAIGVAYARDFDAVFRQVARAQSVPLYPDLLAGAAGLKQPDGIHPSAAGVRVIAGRLAPVVARSLRRA